MRLDVEPYVGRADARAVHGHSRGADLVVVGPEPSADLRESLEPFALNPVVPDGGGLEALARAAEQPGGAMVVVSGGLAISPVALLDLLDRPGDPTAVATLDPATGASSVPASQAEGFPLLRVQAEQRLVHSVGTSRHTVTAPTHLSVGLLRVGAADRAEAARAWRAATTSASAADPAVDPFDLALLALVRGGVRVGVAPLGPFDVRRGEATSRGVAGSAWQQRLRGASRGGDGFFSTRAIRPLSRRLTAVGLRLGWTPNAVTISSLGLGLVAAAAAAVDNRWTWVLAAVLLQVAIVVDCVDGELARFTRRFSALGAWLDAVGDRVKEYALLAAVAWVAVRRGEDAWWLATLGLVAVTNRHLEDYAYADRARGARAHLEPDRLDVDEPRDLGPHGARVTLPPPLTRAQETVFWAKKVLHMPIAERYLVLSVALLTYHPRWVLVALVVAVLVAFVWTQGGRTAKALMGMDGFRPSPQALAGVPGYLDHELDRGPLAKAVGRLAGLPLQLAYPGCLFVLGGAVAAARGASAWLVLALVVVGVVVIAAATRPPLTDRLAWQLPAALWVVEAGLVVGLAWSLPESRRWVVFAYLAAVAWHRYDVVYRLRDTGRPAAPWVSVVTLGTEGRVVVLAVLWTLGVPFGTILPWAALVLFVVFALESALGWRAWAAARAAEADERVGAAGGATGGAKP